MAVATRNRSKSANVSKTAIDQVGSFLQDLSAKPKEELSLREAIDQLREPIQAALAKGYSYPEIATMLGEQGITTTASTLKRYISLGNSSSRGRKPKTTRTSKSQPEAEAPATKRRNAKTTEAASVAAPKGRRKTAAASADVAAQTTVKSDKTEKTSRGRSKAASKASAQATKTPARGRKKTTG